MYDKRFEEILNFISIYDKLINCHIVDFITDELWKQCLPDELRLELERDDIECFYWTEDDGDSHPVLNQFIKQARSLSLQSCSTEINSKDLANVLPIVNDLSKCKQKDVKTEFMNVKKSHEVESLGNIVGAAAASTGSLVIDAGAGKAYLSTFLAENHDVPVLAIDSSQSCCKGATFRQNKLKKRTKCSQNLVRYIVNEINENTNYIKMINEHFDKWKLDRNLVLTGLHACGSLTHSVIKTFLTTKDIHFMCIVPCCYHLTNETLNEKISFSKNARMLAQQSVERSLKNKSVSSSLFYRAVLQVILHSIGIILSFSVLLIISAFDNFDKTVWYSPFRLLGVYNARVGRGGPLNDFPSYALWAFSKIGVGPEKIPSVETLESVYRSHKHLSKRFYKFQMLRIHTGLVLEAAIMLDRILFLQKSNLCSKLAILRLFDPILSPRHYGIVAIK